jgi:hypothetical protein
MKKQMKKKSSSSGRTWRCGRPGVVDVARVRVERDGSHPAIASVRETDIEVAQHATMCEADVDDLEDDMSIISTRWAAIGAAAAVTLGAGGIGLVSATSPAGALTFIPITPCRVIDTRPAPDNVGSKSSPLGPGEVHTVTVHGTNGDCTGIPTTAKAVSLNVTAVGATQPTFLTLWATGQTRPLASSLNPTPGQPPTPNAVTTNVDTNGRFNIYNLQGNVHVLADINGYYTDHNHDDRYYTKTQVDTGRVVSQSFSPFGMVFTGTASTSTYNSCPTRPTGGGTGVLALDLPAGAHIDAISASVLDDGSPNAYTVTVNQSSVTATGLDFTLMGTASKGPSPTFGVTSVDLSPSIDTTINAGDTLTLYFSTVVNSNAICGVTVEYTLPSL